MTHPIETRREHRRGCGYRKPGGLYLVSDGSGKGCERMPIPLEVCPTCSQGIKPARGWSWIESGPILAANPCRKIVRNEPLVDLQLGGPSPGRALFCIGCPMTPEIMGRVGLLWVGMKYYATTDDVLKEAAAQGISRRIPAIPQGFKLGEHWVWLAHQATIPPVHDDQCPALADPPEECVCEADPTPGVFQVFKPARLEYVVEDGDSQEKLGRMIERDVTLVKIERLGENLDLPTA